MGFEDSVDVAAWVFLACFVVMIARGLVRWRSDGEDEAHAGLMGAVFPVFHLLSGIVPYGLLTALTAFTLAVLIVWRLRLSRRRRREGGAPRV